MTDRPLQLLVTVLPVLSAGLYLLGLSYHQGYLAAFGIDDSLYPLATDRALFSGLLAFIGVSFPAIVYGLLALSGFVVAVLVAAVRTQAEREQHEFQAGRGWFATAIGEQQGLPAASKLVMCGEHWCSFWSATGAVTVRRDSVQRLLSANSSASGAAR